MGMRDACIGAVPQRSANLWSSPFRNNASGLASAARPLVMSPVRSRSILTVLGRVRIRRPYYWCDACQHPKFRLINNGTSTEPSSPRAFGA